MVILQPDCHDPLRTEQFRPASLELVTRIGFDVESRERPRLRALPFLDFIVQFFPCFAADVFAAIVCASKDSLQDDGEQEYDAIRPAFIVKLAEDS